MTRHRLNRSLTALSPADSYIQYHISPTHRKRNPRQRSPFRRAIPYIRTLRGSRLANRSRPSGSRALSESQSKCSNLGPNLHPFRVLSFNSVSRHDQNSTQSRTQATLASPAISILSHSNVLSALLAIRPYYHPHARPCHAHHTLTRMRNKCSCCLANPSLLAFRHSLLD